MLCGIKEVKENQAMEKLVIPQERRRSKYIHNIAHALPSCPRRARHQRVSPCSNLRLQALFSHLGEGGRDSERLSIKLPVFQQEVAETILKRRPAQLSPYPQKLSCLHRSSSPDTRGTKTVVNVGVRKENLEGESVRWGGRCGSPQRSCCGMVGASLSPGMMQPGW